MAENRPFHKHKLLLFAKILATDSKMARLRPMKAARLAGFMPG
jgi:hypothetical protein